MSLLVFLAVLAAAFIHAGWNAVIKTGQNKQAGMMLLTLGHSAVAFCIIWFRPVPAPEVWPWILASGLIHTAYQLFLAYAYEQGDLSRVYPLARGGAPLIVLLITLALALDPLGRFELLGILVLGLGIFLMARGVFSSGESRRMLPFAAGSALATAGYSLVDGLGARLSGDAVGYTAWLLLVSSAFYLPVILMLRGRGALAGIGARWPAGLLAGGLSYLAYALVVWAMTEAPIALVTALRETSILFAVAFGWWLFGERVDGQKMVAAGLIVAGVMLTRLAAP